MTSNSLASLQYRAPRAFVQFVGEQALDVAPENIISVQTTKAINNPAGSFEIVFKSGSTEKALQTAQARPLASAFDWWLERLRPMTLTVIAIGSEEELSAVRTNLAPPAKGQPLNTVPDALRNAVIMLGFVEECAITVTMTESGPQRAIRVTGKDFGKVFLDDNLNRLARATTINERTETRMITVGDVGPDERARFLDRSSINGSQTSMFWKDFVAHGSDSKIPLIEALTNIALRAPSFNVRLSNGKTLQDYFDVGELQQIDNSRNTTTVSRILMSPELTRMSVRATLTLLMSQGPVWNAMQTLAPPPMAEMFVDTFGMQVKLFVRRPPFFRPRLMPNMKEKMADFMLKAAAELRGDGTVGNGARAEAARRISEILSQYIGSEDQFTAENDPTFVHGRVHTAEGYHVLGYSVGYSMSQVVTLYQIYPSILNRGGDSELAIQQGVASYLYDLKAAQRYGTSKTFKFGCPWDIIGTGTQAGRRLTSYLTRAGSSSDYKIELDDQGAQSFKRNPLSYANTELALANAETMRQYYYQRDNSGMLYGQLTLVGNNKYRIGDRVHLPNHDDKVFYIEAVQHSYQYGRSFLTTLAVSRGQPMTLLNPAQRLVNYEDSLDPQVSQTIARERRVVRRDQNE